MTQRRSAEIRLPSERVISRCRRCPRLVEWRERVAREKVRRFAEERYWGKPVPGFGDPGARLVLVGLAPAAHGGNRTGRMFTGDRSGEWLYRALYRAGFASRPHSSGRGDGLVLADCYITAAARCAPPGNRPLREELQRCRPWLLQEMQALRAMRVIVGLGAVGYRAAAETLERLGRIAGAPPFGHGVIRRSSGLVLIGSYHPSQQNTFTGRLTEPMFDAVFRAARRELDGL